MYNQIYSPTDDNNLLRQSLVHANWHKGNVTLDNYNGSHEGTGSQLNGLNNKLKLELVLNQQLGNARRIWSLGC